MLSASASLNVEIDEGDDVASADVENVDNDVNCGNVHDSKDAETIRC